MPTIELRAPAKVNLGLQITGVREDGYHLLDSWFVPLDLADRVQVTARGAGAARVTLHLSGDTAGGLPQGPDNLAALAARRFLEGAGLAADVELELEKHIPAGAGLGGGSSDAGAVLRGLNQLFPGALGASELAQIACALGADVPFFLDPRPSRVRGVGDWIEPLAGLPGLALLLAHPGVSLATAQVYAAWDERDSALTRKPARPTMPPAFGPGFDMSALAGLLENDLEPAAVRLCPPIARLEEQIASLGAVAVGMSGSGAAVFGIFGDRAAADEALANSHFTSDGASSDVWARVACTLPSS